MSAAILLTSRELAELVPMRRDEASKMLKSAHEGRQWRKVSLRISWSRGNGGRQRVVQLESLPLELQTKYWKEKAITGGAHPDQVNEYREILETAKSAPTKRKTPTKEELEEAEQRWKNSTTVQQEKAEKALNAIILIDRLVSDGSRVDPAINQVAKQQGVSASSIYKWRRKVSGWPRAHRLYALLPGHGGGARKVELCPAAWKYIKADYLRPEAPALTAVYERATRQGQLEGWTLPSYKTVLRRIQAIDPQPVVLAREGLEALERMYPAQERDKTCFHSMEAVNADGHKFDVFVRWPDGEVSRPIMCAWQDLYSGKFLSYRVTKTENSDTIRLSFGDIIETYGIPKHAYLDNGRGFASKWLTGGMPNRFRFKVKEDEPAGILTKLGVNVHWATPYHGQAKPIERAFRDLCEYVAKHPAFSGAYTGNNPMAKPENYGSKAVPFELFMEILDQEMEAHNAREGRRSKVCAGRSIDQAFEASYAVSPILQATEHQKLFCLMTGEGVTPKRGSGEVHLHDNRYWSEELNQYRSQKLTVRFDPDNLHEPIWVYSLKGEFICMAPCIGATGFNDTQAAREHARKKNQFKKAQKEKLKALRDMEVLEATIPNISIDDPDKVHITVSKSIEQKKEAVIAEEQLNLKKLPTVERKPQPAPASEFNARLKGFVSNLKKPDSESADRPNTVKEAMKQFTGNEVKK